MSEMSETSKASPQVDPEGTGTMSTTDDTGTSDETLRLDGNAAAGMLAEIFMYDMTAAQSTCAHCGCTAALGALLMYGGQTGTILRCPTCDQVELRIMHIPERSGQRAGQFCLDMRGMALLQITP
jgi:hypothetical protein